MNSASVSYIHNQGMGFNPLVEIESYTISDNLLGFWKFNDGTGTTVIDYSIFSNHGSIINRNNTDHSWTKINDKYSYKISSNYNSFRRTEHIRWWVLFYYLRLGLSAGRSWMLLRFAESMRKALLVEGQNAQTVVKKYLGTIMCRCFLLFF